MQPKEMLQLVKEGWSMGFRAFKIRMDWRGWRQDADPNKDFQLFESLSPWFHLLSQFKSEGSNQKVNSHYGYSSPEDFYSAYFAQFQLVERTCQ